MNAITPGTNYSDRAVAGALLSLLEIDVHSSKWSFGGSVVKVLHLWSSRWISGLILVNSKRRIVNTENLSDDPNKRKYSNEQLLHM